VGDEGKWRDRYSRQLVLASIGEEGQRRLGEAKAVVVGAGGLGSNSVDLLVRMGFGNVLIIDHDRVDLSNLHRVRIFGEVDVGRSKVDILQYRLGYNIEGADLRTEKVRLVPENALDLLKGADVVLDGLDNMESRYVLNDACLELGIPWVYGGVVSTGGLVAPFPAGGPCFRCLFPDPPEPGSLPTTETHGIHPALPSVVASIQVALASRIILQGIEEPNLTAMDLWYDDWRVIRLTRREDCPACVQGRREFLGTG
jgi:adenylyltransferase/sulfurtransferase